jgi:hypothetical protein
MTQAKQQLPTTAVTPDLAQRQVWPCHHRQLAGMDPSGNLPRAICRLLISREQFTRVIPAWDGRRAKERDLFAGIDE